MPHKNLTRRGKFWRLHRQKSIRPGAFGTLMPVAHLLGQLAREFLPACDTQAMQPLGPQQQIPLLPYS